MHSLRSTRLIICVLGIPWLLAIAGFGFLFFKRFPLSGIFLAETALDGKSPWIDSLLPSERVTSPGRQEEGWVGQRVTADPVYFRLRSPGPYARALLEFEFRAARQPLLEFGIVRDEFGKQLEMHPLYSEQLDAPEWRRIQAGAVSGFVRETTPAARVEQSDPHGLFVWHASGTPQLLMDDAAPSSRFPLSLRGAHDLYAVPAGGALRLTLYYQDVNRAPGSDAIVFRVFRGDEELSALAFVQSGTYEPRMGRVRSHTIDLPTAAPGVYRISIAASDDIFLRALETTSRRWVIGPRIYLGDVVGFETKETPKTLWTTSRHLVAQTFHREGLQTIRFGPTQGELLRAHAALRLDRTDSVSSPVAIEAPQGDVKFVLDGFAAVRPDLFFEPQPRRLTDATRLAQEGIVAVRTSYERPEIVEGGWRRARVRIELPPNQDRMRLTLSAPGIAERRGHVDVRRIRVRFERPTSTMRDWWNILRQELATAWRRL